MLDVLSRFPAPGARWAAPAALAALVAWPASPALAAANVSLDARSSQLSLSVSGGIAYLVVGVGAEPVASQALQPTRLALEGSGMDAKADLFWSTDMWASWLLQQDYSVQQAGADTVFQSSGSLALVSESFDCNGPVCAQRVGLSFDSLNTQNFVFTLDADTAYSASGSSGKGQLVSLNRRDPATGDWLPDWQSGWNTSATYGGTPLLGPQAQTAWSLSGTLLAGTYALRNSPDVYSTTEGDGANYSWTYSLRLADTQLAQAVPEPGAWALMLAGLAGIGLVGARRRPG